MTISRGHGSRKCRLSVPLETQACGFTVRKRVGGDYCGFHCHLAFLDFPLSFARFWTTLASPRGVGVTKIRPYTGYRPFPTFASLFFLTTPAQRSLGRNRVEQTRTGANGKCRAPNHRISALTPPHSGTRVCCVGADTHRQAETSSTTLPSHNRRELESWLAIGSRLIV
jgi:hypothetical protein